MTDVWKSTGKKFCEICKCWFPDNKVSIEFHERGDRHKAGIQNRIREISIKSKKEEREKLDLRIVLSQMEQAAAAAMNGQEAPASRSSVKPTGPVLPAYKPPKTNDYTVAKEALKEQKRQLKELKKTAKRSAFWADEEPEEDQIQWVKAETEFGQVYWWNIYTGETRWDAPDRYFTTAEYNEKYAKIAKKYGVGTEAEIAAAEAYNQPTYYTADEFVSKYGSAEAQNLAQATSSYAGGVTGYSSSSYAVSSKNAASESVVPEEIPLPSEIPRTKKSRWDSKTQPPKITIDLKQPKNEPPELSTSQTTHVKSEQEDIKPDLIMVKETVEQRRPAKASTILGPWVPVQKKEEPKKVVLDDLPEEAKNVQEEKELYPEIEESDIAFTEKVAPVKKDKKPKVIEFKKRKTNISARSRLDD